MERSAGGRYRVGEELEEERMDGGEMVEEERVGEGKVPEEDKGWRRVDGIRLSGWRRDGGGRQRMEERWWSKREWKEKRPEKLLEEERPDEGEMPEVWKIESCGEVQRRWRKSVDWVEVLKIWREWRGELEGERDYNLYT
jgi:hypothetical protein